MAIENEQILNAFITEANEGLEDIESQLLAIEAGGPDIDKELVNTVFRAIHSIKGTAGYLGLTTIGALSHEMENVLNMLRNRELPPSGPLVESLLSGADLLRGMVNDIEHAAAVDLTAQLEALHAAVSGQPAPAPEPELDGEIDIERRSGEIVFMMVPRRSLVTRQRQGQSIFVVCVDLMEHIHAAGRTPLDLIKAVLRQGELLDSYISTAGIGTLSDELPSEIEFRMLVSAAADDAALIEALDLPAACVERIATAEETSWGAAATPTPATAPAPAAPQPVAAKTPSPAPVVTAPPAVEPPSAPAGNGENANTGAARRPDRTLRVNVSVLDRLMRLAGELVLGRNQLLQSLRSNETTRLVHVSTRLDQITTELQDSIMQTRLQPVSTVFDRFPRVVRDLSHKLGKNCQLRMEGTDVELDKAILEAIADPLTHLVRNSLDHGIESAERRAAAGKPATGTLLLGAYHVSGKVAIRVRDDGAGIDPKKLRAKAIEKKIITPEEAQALSDREAVRLVFHPGFSTAEVVTDTSGRGVGMDVVRSNVEKLGGVVDIDTELGVGTTFTIKLPLTLAIIPSLVVGTSGQRFAVPQVHIAELVRVRTGERNRRIEQMKGCEVLRLRGRLLPLVRLSEVLGLREEKAHDPNAAANILVVEAGAIRYGVFVDTLHDSEEIVVKPLGRHLRGCRCLAGATILGDGRVALILDATGLANLANVEAAESDASDTPAEQVTTHNSEALPCVLIRNHEREHFAAPMSLVARIERVRTSQIDTVGGRPVLQYRGSTLPLLRLEGLINAAAPETQRDYAYVIVFAVDGREVGLVAPELFDIREISTQFDRRAFIEPGVLGTIVVEQKTTRVLDLPVLARRAFPETAQASGSGKSAAPVRRSTSPAADSTSNGDGPTPAPLQSSLASMPAEASGAPRVLLAEDSDFFRAQLTSFLEEAGYEVDGHADGALAWAAVEAGGVYDLIVTDVEMPNLDGLSLTRKLRAHGPTGNLPIIAVTSLAAEEDMQRGIEAGVSEYHVKLDPERLLSAVRRLLSNRTPNGACPTAS